MFNYVAFKQYLNENGIKQKFIAQKTDIREFTFSAIVTGKIKCSLENYVNICKALEVPLGTFIDDLDESEQSAQAV